MGNMLLIDTSRCIECRACQVACKKWHDLPPKWDGDIAPEIDTELRLDMIGTTYTLVKETESELYGRIRRLFFKDQCRHCQSPNCMKSCPVTGAIVQEASGAVVITDQCNTRLCKKQPCLKSCPFSVPRVNTDLRKATKCDFCYDRISDGSGRATACADSCPSEAIIFGDANEVQAEAAARLNRVKTRYPDAEIYYPQKGHVEWLLIGSSSVYGLKTGGGGGGGGGKPGGK